MISIRVDSSEVRKYLQLFPKVAARALETAIDKTAADIKKGEIEAMRSVFDKPTAYTLNSLKLTRTKGHNMTATVWFKEPDRMTDHYLLPEVDGGERKLKGFERALNNNKFVPGEKSLKDQYGNVPNSQLRQILGVLGKAERVGYQANITTKSAKRNRKQRDYVFLQAGSSRGKLPPGIYRRVAQAGNAIGGKTKKYLPFGTFKKGMRRGKFFSVIRARGLEPILIIGKQHGQYSKRLKFYEIAANIHSKVFTNHFYAELSRRLP
ncbi:MAG: hypothetical protein ACOYB1_18530 [Limnohabitans sp.]